MNTHLKKWLAILLAVSLVMGLAGCGEKEENAASGIVYVPEYMDLDISLDYVDGSCVSGDALYLQGSCKQDSEPTYDESGNILYYEDHYETVIYRLSLDDMSVAKLENYEMPAIPEGEEGEVYLEAMFSGEDGTIWVHERTYINHFELPEDFDPETESKWDYPLTTEITLYRRHLDSTGAELSRIDLSEQLSDIGDMSVEDFAMDASGNLYLIVQDYSEGGSLCHIVVLDSSSTELFRITEQDTWGSLFTLGDGSVAMMRWNNNGDQILTGIDLAAKDWGTEYPLGNNVYDVRSGNDTYLYLYQINDSLYGLRKDAQEGEQILSWIDSDINQNNLIHFTILSDGRILAISADWTDPSKAEIELAILVPTDASTLPERQVLTLACMYLGYDLREKVLEFNKSHNDIRISVKTYSDYSTEDDYNAGQTRLLTEIGAGEVPDILYTGSISISRLEGKGILEDLWPFIENDPEIGREGVMEQVFKAVEKDGKLYRIFDNFSIRTLAGAASVVGDRTSWTLQDLQAALATMPEDCTITSYYTTKSDMLYALLYSSLSDFVDWSTGECYFDGEAFRSLLEFCQLFPLEYNWDDADWDAWVSEPDLIAQGKQMLMQGYLSTPSDMSYFNAIFGGDASFVGYPNASGTSGSSFAINDGLAMTATCKNKEAAWEFMRYMLLPEENPETSLYSFSTNRTDFDRLMEQYMTPTYSTDENGQQILDENGQPVMETKTEFWITDGSSVPFYYTTQEEYDQFMDLYNSVEDVFDYDIYLYDIVVELTEGYFNGDRSLEDTVQQIQSRVKLYVNENR